jgi:hypothetical protein
MSLLAKLWARRRDRPVFVGVALFVLSAFAAYLIRSFVTLYRRDESKHGFQSL